MYLIPYTTNKSKLSLIYRFLCLRFVQFATHTYYLAILHSIIFWKKNQFWFSCFCFICSSRCIDGLRGFRFLWMKICCTGCSLPAALSLLVPQDWTAPHQRHTIHTLSTKFKKKRTKDNFKMFKF